MATTYISINVGQRLGALDRNTIDQLRVVKESLAKLKAIMDTQVDVNDYSMVESQHGLQAGKGQTFYNLIAGSNTDLAASTSITQLLNWCG